MSLILYMHPLASFCHKVLIALYEKEVPFHPVTVDLGDPGSAAPLLRRWPAAKIPVLYDTTRDRTVPETSIIVEYLQEHYPGPVPLLPADPDRRLDARLWDRFFDLHVSVPMQKIVTDRLRPEAERDDLGVVEAHRTLDVSYDMADAHLRERSWAAGEAFTLADCAAAPGLFFAGIVHPFGEARPALATYFNRLAARPSVARTLREARPFFPLFPYREAIPPRFLAD